MDWGRKWLVDFNAGKTELAFYDRSNSNASINVKMDSFVLEEKSSFKMLGLPFSSKLDWGSLTLLLKLPPKEFFFLRLLCISVNLTYGHAWYTVVMSGLVPLVATWNC